MGWLAIDYRAPGESHADFFQREVLGEGDQSRIDQSRIIDSHFDSRSRTLYAAVESEGVKHEVWALVVLTEGRPGGRFGWKAMDETQGPVEDECPSRILDLLSPTENRNAKVWRQRCRDREKRLAQ